MLPAAIELLGLAGLPVTQRMVDDWWKATKGKPLTMEGKKRVEAALTRKRATQRRRKVIDGNLQR